MPSEQQSSDETKYFATCFWVKQREQTGHNRGRNLVRGLKNKHGEFHRGGLLASFNTVIITITVTRASQVTRFEVVNTQTHRWMTDGWMLMYSHVILCFTWRKRDWILTLECKETETDCDALFPNPLPDEASMGSLCNHCVCQTRDEDKPTHRQVWFDQVSVKPITPNHHRARWDLLTDKLPGNSHFHYSCQSHVRRLFVPEIVVEWVFVIMRAWNNYN